VIHRITGEGDGFHQNELATIVS